MGKRGAHKEKIQLINSSCVYAYIGNRKHARTKMAAVPTANARAFLLVRRKSHSSRMRQSSLIVALFSFLFCVVLLRRRQRDLHSDHNFGISFCPSLMCAGNAVPVDVLSSNSCREEARSLKVLSSSALFCCFFFRKKRFLFQRERELFSGFCEMEELLTNLSLF